MNDSNTGLPVLTHPPGSLSKARVWKADPAGRTMDGAPVLAGLECWGWCSDCWCEGLM